MNSLGFSVHKIMPLQIEIILFLPFHSGCFYLIFLLNFPGRTFRTLSHAVVRAIFSFQFTTVFFQRQGYMIKVCFLFFFNMCLRVYSFSKYCFTCMYLINFGMLCFYLHSPQGISLISLWFLLWPPDYLGIWCLISTFLWISQISFFIDF